MEKEDLWEEIKFELDTLNMSKSSNKAEALLGSGNRNADILFIGDDSSLYETEDLKVTIGSCGEFLIKLCDLAEISPKNYYITTLTKSDENYRKTFDKEKLKDILHMQIALIEPKVIMAFGQDTAELLLEREVDLKKEHGNVLDWKGNIKLIITYEVSFVKKARESSDKHSKVATDFWKDLKKVKNILDENN